MKPDVKGRDDVRKLVDSFYTSAAKDSLLGEIFRGLENCSVKQDLYIFWEGVLLDKVAGRSHNFPAHIELMFTPRHFVRWLSLFMENIDDLYSGPNAEKAKVIVIRKSEEFQASLKISRF